MKKISSLYPRVSLIAILAVTSCSFFYVACNCNYPERRTITGDYTNQVTFVTKNPKYQKVYLEDFLLKYRSELLNNIVPFWLNYGVDWQNGGINTCLSDDGKVLSTDKYMWSQLRAIWTFSALYNKIEKRQEWLDVALQIFEFVKKHGRDDEGKWVYAVDEDGAVLKGAISIYADGFAIDAFTELAKATGRDDVIQLALETYRNVKRRLELPGSYPTEPLPIPPGSKAHGIAMIFGKVFYDLGKYLNNKEIMEDGYNFAEEVMTVFRRPKEKRLFEFVKLDDTFLDNPPGLTTVPGHAIESMWFMIEIYQDYNNQARIQQALECIRWHIELGWDPEYGGIFAAYNAEGSFWEHQWDHKLWWVQVEALYAILLGFSISKDTYFLDWFLKVHDYAFKLYPVHYYGEWYQRLDRYGDHVNNIAAMPVKDPFHVARSMINCINLLEHLTSKQQN